MAWQSTVCRRKARRVPGSDVAEIGEPVWVGDFWDMFDAGDLLELKNLKAIAEHRHPPWPAGDPGLDEMTSP